MKLKFKHQKFQADAAKAVVDVFKGQPFSTPSYLIDKGTGYYQMGMTEKEDYIGWSNAKIDTCLSDDVILDNIKQVQRNNHIVPSGKLEGKYNLTIEMETGVGKTYTYIKTMYELNKHYGWSKFIVVVPSIAVREGVYKSFQTTQEHFAEEYGKKIRFFIYNSSKLAEIDRFASDNAMHVMIINSQAFNAKGKDARRINMRLDAFRSRRPIDIIAKTNPILIIDEPQSVEGKQTKKNLEMFHPLMTLRYSATHKADSIYNMIYRLDAVEAYNRKLVKRIAVKGISKIGNMGITGYIYLQNINLTKTYPTATIEMDVKGTSGIKRKIKKVSIGDNLYSCSNGMEEYIEDFVVTGIDARDDSVSFLNGIKIYAGDVMGDIDEEQFRRIQIRETILSHIERERVLFAKGIKVLSLFFIDEVKNYRYYDDTGKEMNGRYADIFEQEYRNIVDNLQLTAEEAEYSEYLKTISASKTHAGYFSIDKKGRMTDSKLSDKKEKTSDDMDAYDLIMKNKEILLERDPAKSPVRFIFSHSALREGWDNPNVFQICTLKQSGSEVRKRQEVGRGLRLCVNQDGERMDINALGADVQNVNVLTVIASESYDSFAKGLQTELADEMKAAEGVVTESGDSAFDSVRMIPENARCVSVTLRVDEKKLQMPEFKALWSKINTKSMYVVDFDTDELVQKCIAVLDSRLQVQTSYFKVETGRLMAVNSKEELKNGSAMIRVETGSYDVQDTVRANVKYDLVGKLVDETGLTRKTIVQILTGIQKSVFEQFRYNPEEFIMKAASLINDEKVIEITKHISYHATDEKYDTDIFTKSAIKGKPGMNAVKVNKHLYDYLVYDSTNEKEFAGQLEICRDVAVYVKLPNKFYISTPVGHYTPDWAIAFYEGTVKHIYFVAETKGSGSSMQLRRIEELKIHCAKEHFKAISNDEVKFDVIDCFETLEMRMKQ